MQEVTFNPVQERKYLPAAGKHWRLPLYDPLCKLFGIDSDRKRLIAQADLESAYRILDIGCGTGTLICMIRRKYADIEIFGLDPDTKALARAKRKNRRSHHNTHFDKGFSDELPYPSSSFDRVFSSYMLHHMNEEEKEGTFAEAHRVLRPGGSFHMLDFEQQEGKQKRIFANSGQHIDLMKKAGFTKVCKVDQKNTVFGRVAYYRAIVS